MFKGLLIRVLKKKIVLSMLNNLNFIINIKYKFYLHLKIQGYENYKCHFKQILNLRMKILLIEIKVFKTFIHI